jgi:hypothetical protein
VSAS